jgi:hypothetical protein
MKKRNKVIKIGVCQGRHEMPVTDYVYGHSIEEQFNFIKLKEQADAFMAKKVKSLPTTVEVYCTGYVAAVVAIINAAIERGCTVYLRHYKRDTGEYLAQPVAKGVGDEDTTASIGA